MLTTLNFTFKIVDVERKTTGGFARGILIVEGFEEFQGKNLIINFQNEFLVARIKDSTGKEKVFFNFNRYSRSKSNRYQNTCEDTSNIDHTFLSISDPQ